MSEIAASQSRPLSARANIERIAASAAWLAPCALFLIALMPRIWVVWFNRFDGLYGQDSYAYFDYARQLFSALNRGQAPPPFWWPLGYPALLNLSFVILGTSVHSAQIITIVSGSLVAPITYLLARETIPGSRWNLGGLVAGAIVAFGGQLVQSSVVIMADAPASMSASLSAWLLLRYRRTAYLPTLALSAMGMSFAVITRWENLGFVLAWFAALIAVSLQRDRDSTGRSFPSRLRTTALPLLISMGLAAAVLLPQLASQVLNTAPLAGQSWLEGWSPYNLFGRSFDTVDGHFEYSLPVALFYAQVFFHPAYLFPLLTPFMIIGAWVFAKRLRLDPSPFILVVGWITVMYMFLAGIPYENFRFGLGFLVPTAVLAGTGTVWVWGGLTGRRSTAHSPLQMRFNTTAPRLALFVVLALALGGTAAWESRVLNPVLSEKQMELSDAQWLASRLPPSAVIYTFGVTEALKEYSTLDAKDLSEETPDRIVADVRANAPAYLFVDVRNIETQWRGQVLAKNLKTLYDQLNPVEMDRTGTYTLFRVGAVP
jgi:hypothetical protein